MLLTSQIVFAQLIKTKLKYNIFFTMQTYKELITVILFNVYKVCDIVLRFVNYSHGKFRNETMYPAWLFCDRLDDN